MGFFAKIAKRLKGEITDPTKDLARQSTYFNKEEIPDNPQEEYMKKEKWLEEFTDIQKQLQNLQDLNKDIPEEFKLKRFNLFPKYEINQFSMQGKLGQGAQGKVLSVKYKPDGNIYALKVISKNMLIRKMLVDQILKEIYIMSQVSHPGIIEFKGCFEDQNNIYLLSEKAGGDHLYNKIKTFNRMEEKQTSKLIY